MQELEGHRPEKLEVAEVRQVKTEKKLSSWKQHPGHKVWELDLSTKLIREAEVESVSLEFGEHGTGTRQKIMQRPNCLYVSALNAHNADKKFLQMITMYKLIKR